LVSIAPEGLTKAFSAISTESNEKRDAHGADGDRTYEHHHLFRGFHGRTADAISATFLGKYREIGKPNVPGHLQAEFGDIESVRALADETIAAIMLEPIQSMAGVRLAAPAFYRIFVSCAITRDRFDL